MRLQLTDPEAIVEYERPISRLGEPVDDPDLFNRIKRACLHRRAFLFVSPEGFVVLKPTGDRGVWVWAAAMERPVDRDQYEAELERLARDIDARYIAFGSERPGFRRVAPRYGYQPTPSHCNGVPSLIWTKVL